MFAKRIACTARELSLRPSGVLEDHNRFFKADGQAGRCKTLCGGLGQLATECRSTADAEDTVKDRLTIRASLHDDKRFPVRHRLPEQSLLHTQQASGHNAVALLDRGIQLFFKRLAFRRREDEI